MKKITAICPILAIAGTGFSARKKKNKKDSSARNEKILRQFNVGKKITCGTVNGQRIRFRRETGLPKNNRIAADFITSKFKDRESGFQRLETFIQRLEKGY